MLFAVSYVLSPVAAENLKRFRANNDSIGPSFSFHMNTLLLASPEDHYAFLLPVMKTLLSQADQLLDDFVYQIPNMPSPQFNSKFQEEFQVSMFGV